MNLRGKIRGRSRRGALPNGGGTGRVGLEDLFSLKKTSAPKHAAECRLGFSVFEDSGGGGGKEDERFYSDKTETGTRPKPPKKTPRKEQTASGVKNLGESCKRKHLTHTHAHPQGKEGVLADCVEIPNGAVWKHRQGGTMSRRIKGAAPHVPNRGKRGTRTIDFVCSCKNFFIPASKKEGEKDKARNDGQSITRQ